MKSQGTLRSPIHTATGNLCRFSWAIRAAATVGELALEQQSRDDRDQIGIAAALAQPIERALDLARAGAHSRQRIGHRVLSVVVGVDAQMRARDVLRNLRDDLGDLVRQRAAVGVAQDDPARARLVGGRGDGQRIGAIALPAIEEMLAVDD